MIGVPPLLAGAGPAQTDLRVAADRGRPVGAPGTAAGVALAGAEAGPVPTALLAVTVNV